MIPLWIWIIAVLLVVGIAMAVLLSSYENKRLTVEYYEIESEKIPEAFDGYRIVFLTDLHCAQFGENNHSMCACKICRTNDRPKIMRVFNPI